jgi:hypothetical protein
MKSSQPKKGNEKLNLKILREQENQVPCLLYTQPGIFYGANYLFDEIGKQLGISADLKRCYPDTYKQILSIAYYLILEDRIPLSRFLKWS